VKLRTFSRAPRLAGRVPSKSHSCSKSIWSSVVGRLPLSQQSGSGPDRPVSDRTWLMGGVGEGGSGGGGGGGGGGLEEGGVCGGGGVSVCRSQQM
jgi:hypothetical protein